MTRLLARHRRQRADQRRATSPGCPGGALRPLRRDFTIVFQDPASSLNPRMTVADIVGEPLRLHRLGAGDDRRDRVARAARPGRPAPGRGRALPARAVRRAAAAGQPGPRAVGRPRLLVADEPTSALDVSVQARVLNLIGRLQRDLGFACLFITHDLAAVEFLAQRVAVMYLGVLVEVAARASCSPHARAPLHAGPAVRRADPGPGRAAGRRRIVLPGELPSPVDPPSGCRFHPRCPVAGPRCAQEVPPPAPGRWPGSSRATWRARIRCTNPGDR